LVNSDAFWAIPGGWPGGVFWVTLTKSAGGWLFWRLRVQGIKAELVEGIVTNRVAQFRGFFYIYLWGQWQQGFPMKTVTGKKPLAERLKMGLQEGILYAQGKLNLRTRNGKRVPYKNSSKGEGLIMGRRKTSRGFTMVEMLMVIGIVVCIGIMLLPAIQSAREKSRCATCIENMRKLGPALHNYHDAHRHFPPSSGVTRDADGKIVAVDGWSWLALIVPYMEGYKENRRLTKLYEGLNLENGRPLTEPSGAKGTPHADLLAARIEGLLCPSFSGSPYADPSTRKEAITNYKSLGATHIESLSVASPHPMRPKYFPKKTRYVSDFFAGKASYESIHPDGALFPGQGIRVAEFSDGTANTIFLTESIEQKFARWTVGSEAAVVGLPPSMEFEKSNNSNYYGPKGFLIMWEDNPENDSIYWTYHTYIDWNYDQFPYTDLDGSRKCKYGPSSAHPEIVNHLFGDGTVRSISRDVTVGGYMWAITRCGGDPL
jgi:hypothetical protein